jgi:hypothetical protein
VLEDDLKTIQGPDHRCRIALISLGRSIDSMGDREEGLVSRAEYEAAVERAERAEQALAGQQRALAAGVPPELAPDFAGTTMSDEELAGWVEKLRDFVADRTAQRLLEAARPDRRGGGRFLVQNGTERRLPPQDLAAIEPDWLRERLQARTSR